MKKFTLLLMAAIMAVASYAQINTVKMNRESVRQMQLMQPDASRLTATQKKAVVKMHGGKAVATSLNAAKQKKNQVKQRLMKHIVSLGSAQKALTANNAQVVTPPAGLEVRLHEASLVSLGTEAGDYTYGNSAYPVSIGFDGDDAYLQGLFYFAPEAWIKGKHNADGSITFANNQYLGKMGDNDVYVVACSDMDENDNVTFFEDFTFAYDAERDTYTYTEYDTNIEFASAPNSLEAYDVVFNVKLAGPDAPRIDTNVIWEQPEGDLAVYSREGDAYYVFMGYLLYSNQSGTPMKIVRNGNTIYMENPISQGQVQGGTWIKGTIEGNKIHMPLRQCVFYNDEDEFGYFTGIFHQEMVYDEYMEEEVPTYVLTNDREITFTINEETGTITMDLKSEIDPETLLADYVYGLAFTYDESWAQVGDCNSVYSLMNDDVVTMPDGAKEETWAFMFNDGDYNSANMTRVAIMGDKMYVAGISESDPESVVVGTIADGKVTFKSDQYLGMGSGYLDYLTFAKYTKVELYDEWYDEWYTDYEYEFIPEFTFNYDAEKQLLTPTTDDVVMLLNAGKGATEILYIKRFFNPEFNYFEEVAAKPANPVIYGFSEWFDDYGYNIFSGDVILKDVNGKYIDKDKVTYIIWTKVEEDMEPLTFYGDEYFGLYDALGVDEIVEMPYTAVLYDAYDYEDITEGASYVTLYQSGFDDLGLQTVYYGGGERNVSDIVWLSGDITGIKNIAASASSDNNARYNLLGQRVNATAKGVIVKNGRKFIVK